MRREVIATWMMIGIVTLMAGFVLLAADVARCTYCPSFTCFNSSSCGAGCVCLRASGELGGECYAAD